MFFIGEFLMNQIHSSLYTIQYFLSSIKNIRIIIESFELPEFIPSYLFMS